MNEYIKNVIEKLVQFRHGLKTEIISILNILHRKKFTNKINHKSGKFQAFLKFNAKTIILFEVVMEVKKYITS